MAGCVGRDPLLPRGTCGLGEGLGPVARAVVGDDPLDRGDAVRGEPGLRALEKPGGGRAFLVVESFGAGETGVSIDGGMEVDVSAPGAALLRPFDRASLGTATPVNAPATAVGNAPDLLHVDVDHMAGALGDDALWFAVRLAGWVNEAPVVQPELPQQTCHGPTADGNTLLFKLKGDACRRPLVLAAHPFDPPNDRARRSSRLAQRCRGAIEQTEVTEGPIAVDPLRSSGTGDAHLGCDVSDRPGAAALDKPASSLQR